MHNLHPPSPKPNQTETLCILYCNHYHKDVNGKDCNLESVNLCYCLCRWMRSSWTWYMHWVWSSYCEEDQLQDSISHCNTPYVKSKRWLKMQMIHCIFLERSLTHLTPLCCWHPCDCTAQVWKWTGNEKSQRTVGCSVLQTLELNSAGGSTLHVNRQDGKHGGVCNNNRNICCILLLCFLKEISIITSQNWFNRGYRPTPASSSTREHIWLFAGISMGCTAPGCSLDCTYNRALKLYNVYQDPVRIDSF